MRSKKNNEQIQTTMNSKSDYFAGSTRRVLIVFFKLKKNTQLSFQVAHAELKTKIMACKSKKTDNNFQRWFAATLLQLGWYQMKTYITSNIYADNDRKKHPLNEKNVNETLLCYKRLKRTHFCTITVYLPANKRTYLRATRVTT